MKERPLICRDDEVRAFLDGRKTQLRRPVKPIFSDAFPGTPLFKVDGGVHVPLNDALALTSAFPRHCPFGIAGDRLWVRECWAPMAKHSQTRVAYRSTMMIQNQTNPRTPTHDLVPWPVDNTGRIGHNFRAWRPSSQMPRWASHITLEITNVRVKRLQDITKQDAISEGAKRVALGQGFLSDGRCAFRDAWDHAYGESIDPRTGKSNAEKNPFAWINNPFVWVIGVEVRT